MAYFVIDEGGHREYATLPDALEDAKNSIIYARECCDPEWPWGVQDLAIYEADAGCECPDEDGKILYKSTAVNIEYPEDGDESGCEFYCDYKMQEAPHDHTQG